MLSLVDELRQYGFVRAPWMLSPLSIAHIEGHFMHCTAWPAHVVCKVPGYPAGGMTVSDALTMTDWPMFSVRMQDVVSAPHLFELALIGLGVAGAYFNEPARLYSMNAFWTQPASRSYEETHYWHRDGDDRKQMALFVYGADVLEIADGPHRYERGTHTEPPGHLHHPVDENNVTDVYGPAGTVFFTDPHGIHQGIRPSRGRRILMWARYGVSDVPASYVADQLSPASRDVLGDRYPTDPDLQKAIELVVR